jgi:hypothetical protein
MVVVQMKKGLLIITALICSFLITELIVSLFLDFPKYGIDRKVKGITTLDNRGEIYKPYSKYINNEDGYKVFNRNNKGLPGSDIISSDSAKYILVLGNSFVEGYQVDPDSLSTSIFQKLCIKYHKNYQVVNLGASGHDAFDLWFRANYFERIFPPFAVILVITEYNLFNHTGVLDFTLPAYFGEANNSPSLNISTLLRNSSSFINLVATAIKYSSNKNITAEDVIAPGEKKPGSLSDTALHSGSGLGECLLEFNKRYDNKFIALSILQNAKQNIVIEDFCRNNKINFNSSELLTPQFEIKGGGHLNTEGNKKLGELLYESYIRANKK